MPSRYPGDIELFAFHRTDAATPVRFREIVAIHSIAATRPRSRTPAAGPVRSGDRARGLVDELFQRLQPGPHMGSEPTRSASHSTST